MLRSLAADGKEPLDIHGVFRRLRLAVAGLPRAAMFEPRDRGHGSPFEQLVGALIAARTRDQVTVPVCLCLFERAHTPRQLAALSAEEPAALFKPASFAQIKVRDLIHLAQQIVADDRGQVPDTIDAQTAWRGVGPKNAALTLGVALGKPAIPVEIHVRRVTNHWRLCYDPNTQPDPGRTGRQAASRMQGRNQRLHRALRKHICICVDPPKYAICLLLSMCGQVGLTSTR